MKIVLVDGKTLIKILSRRNFIPRRQRGSHVQLEDGEGRRVTVPVHAKEIGRGLLGKIPRDAEIERGEFESLRRKL